MGTLEIDSSSLWWVGVLLSILSAVFGSLGDNLIKLSFTLEELSVDRGNPPTPVYCRSIWWIGMLCLTVLNTGCTMAAYSFADASLTIPFAGLHICFNIGFARILNHEHFTNRQLGYTFIILCGVIIVLVAGNHDTVYYSVSQIASLFKSVAFIVISLLLVIAISLLAPVMLLHFDARMRCFSSSALTGTIASITQVMAKIISELLTQAVNGEGEEVFSTWVFYVSLVCLICAATSQLFMLNRTLSHFNAFVVVPVYNSFLILLGSIYALVLFREYERFTLVSQILMPIGVVMTGVGVGLLAHDHDPEAKDELALGPPIDPLEEFTGDGGSGDLALVPLARDASMARRRSEFHSHSPIMSEHFGSRPSSISLHNYKATTLGGGLNSASSRSLHDPVPSSPYTADVNPYGSDEESEGDEQLHGLHADGIRTPPESLTLQ